MTGFKSTNLAVLIKIACIQKLIKVICNYPCELKSV